MAESRLLAAPLQDNMILMKQRCSCMGLNTNKDIIIYYIINTRRFNDVSLKLGHRLCRCNSNKTTLDQHLKCSEQTRFNLRGICRGQIIYFNPARRRGDNLKFYDMFIYFMYRLPGII